jgi:hypothetical protein
MKMWKDRYPLSAILSNEKILWLKADILIHPIVGVASTKEAVTVGVNVHLTSGKETEIINAI